MPRAVACVSLVLLLILLTDTLADTECISRISVGDREYKCIYFSTLDENTFAMAEAAILHLELAPRSVDILEILDAACAAERVVSGFEVDGGIFSPSDAYELKLTARKFSAGSTTSSVASMFIFLAERRPDGSFVGAPTQYVRNLFPPNATYLCLSYDLRPQGRFERSCDHRAFFSNRTGNPLWRFDVACEAIIATDSTPEPVLYLAAAANSPLANAFGNGTETAASTGRPGANLADRYFFVAQPVLSSLWIGTPGTDQCSRYIPCEEWEVTVHEDVRLVVSVEDAQCVTAIGDCILMNSTDLIPMQRHFVKESLEGCDRPKLAFIHVETEMLTWFFECNNHVRITHKVEPWLVVTALMLLLVVPFLVLCLNCCIVRATVKRHFANMAFGASLKPHEQQQPSIANTNAQQQQQWTTPQQQEQPPQWPAAPQQQQWPAAQQQQPWPAAQQQQPWPAAQPNGPGNWPPHQPPPTVLPATTTPGTVDNFTNTNNQSYPTWKTWE